MKTISLRTEPFSKRNSSIADVYETEQNAQIIHMLYSKLYSKQYSKQYSKVRHMVAYVYQRAFTSSEVSLIWGRQH